ncbi:MAG: hypothetical protein WA964_15515 [Ilumatobacter sp.]|uniref:hypothetical protein n=1 Tax=Ilumatobacter sp. TaxID=1967498 RepID=UPI003C7109E2
MTAALARATNQPNEQRPNALDATSRPPVLRRLVLLVCGVLALAGCQLDVEADVVVEADGTGTITVTAEADAELVEQVPTIADDLVLDDIIEAGWTVDGPTPTSEGGLVLILTNDFEGQDEATNLLRSLGPPFNDPDIRRGQNGDTATNTARVNLGLPNGFAAFADDELISAVGSVPFEEQFAQSGVDPATAMSAVLRLTIPGEIVDGETNGEALGDGRLQWIAPLDGTILEATARTEQAPSAGGAWARPVSNVALIALVAWVGFMTLFIAYVAIARFRRSRRHRRRALP